MQVARYRVAVLAAVAAAAAGTAVWLVVERSPRRITVDYPVEASVFPPEFPAPMFIWHDASDKAAVWTVDVAFAGPAPAGDPLRVTASGERMPLEKSIPAASRPPTSCPS